MNAAATITTQSKEKGEKKKGKTLIQGCKRKKRDKAIETPFRTSQLESDTANTHGCRRYIYIYIYLAKSEILQYGGCSNLTWKRKRNENNNNNNNNNKNDNDSLLHFNNHSSYIIYIRAVPFPAPARLFDNGRGCHAWVVVLRCDCNNLFVGQLVPYTVAGHDQKLIVRSYGQFQYVRLRHNTGTLQGRITDGTRYGQTTIHLPSPPYTVGPLK